MVHFINEGNKELQNRCFPLAKGVRKHLQQTLDSYNGDRTVDGYKRLNNILNMDTISYQEMKRIKNFFDNFQGSDKSAEFILNGGEPMKLWVNNTLYSATKAIEDFKQAKKDAGMKNAFIRSHEKDRQNRKNKPTQSKIQTNNIAKHLGNNDNIRYESMQKNAKTIVITEGQKRVLIREALADMNNLDNFLNELTNISSFKGRYQYCIQNLGQPQGRGSSRVVFQLDDNKILKLALNRKGFAQNHEEYCGYANNLGLTPEMFNIGENDEYIVSEFVLPAKKQDFKQCLGITFEDFQKFIWTSCAVRDGKNGKYTWYNQLPEEKYVELLENNDFLSQIDTYIRDTDTPVGDLTRVVNYGLAMRDGQPTIVLLDAGLSSDVWNSYYRRF